MIVKMLKVYMAARSEDRDRLLECVGDLGVVHLTPVDPALATADEQIVAAIGTVGRALQILSGLTPAGPVPSISAVEAAQGVLDIQRRSVERRSRLITLHHQIEQLRIWGDVELKQFDQLREAGVDVRFFSVPTDQVGEIVAECVHLVGELPGKRSLVAVIDRAGEPTVPDQAVDFPLPHRDVPAIRAEAVKLDAAIREDAKRLAELANLVPAMRSALAELRRQGEYTVALHGALAGDHLFAIQGWVPAENAERISAGLVKSGVDTAVRMIEPGPDDQPPTLVRPPRWARPITGLFDILGTVPGYREFDMSGFFMIALPLFAAILIGDAGYGLVFTLMPLLLYRRMVAAAGKSKVHLLIVIGVTTLICGIMSANYFGITPENIARAGGYVTGIGGGEGTGDIEAMRSGRGGWASVGRAMMAVAPLWDADDETVRVILIKLSFVIGCIHLTLARLRQALALFPNIRALAQIGWCIFLWAMLGLILMLFFGGESVPVSGSVISTALIAAGAIVVLFTAPSRNPAKMVGIGFVSSLLPALGTFSDTMSYIRLMAVGMATYYIASAFNGLGATIAESATWFAAAPIILFGHALNMGLSIIAIFAHGVRLNMLEFSNNAGVQWAGYSYSAFGKSQTKES